jgi:hypothetical protein
VVEAEVKTDDAAGPGPDREGWTVSTRSEVAIIGYKTGAVPDQEGWIAEAVPAAVMRFRRPVVAAGTSRLDKTVSRPVGLHDRG